MGLGGVNPTGHRHQVLIHHAQKAERFVTTAIVTPKTTNSNSLLPNTAASNDIQQHVNSGDVDIRNLTITLIRTFVLQMS